MQPDPLSYLAYVEHQKRLAQSHHDLAYPRNTGYPIMPNFSNYEMSHPLISSGPMDMPVRQSYVQNKPLEVSEAEISNPPLVYSPIVVLSDDSQGGHTTKDDESLLQSTLPPLKHEGFQVKLKQAISDNDKIASIVQKVSAGVSIISAVFLAVSVGTIMVLNNQRDNLQVSSSPRFVRNSAFISCIIWGVVMMKSVTSWLSSSSDSHDRVKSTHSRNKYLVFAITMLTTFKGYTEINQVGGTQYRLQLAKPAAFDDMYDYVKNTKAWNATNEYGGYAYEWTKTKTSKWYETTYNTTSDWVHSNINTTQISHYKDQVLEEFDEWLSQKVDFEKYSKMSTAAKKALWKKFIAE